MAFAGFDAYCAALGITAEEAPAAFAAWLQLWTGWGGGIEQAQRMSLDDPDDG